MTSASRALLLSLLCVSGAFFTACGDDDSSTADTGGVDASTERDTGTTEDTGTAEDTGTVEDTGTEDTGTEDAGTEDAGTEEDAGTDAGPRACGDLLTVSTVEELVALAPDPYGRPEFESDWEGTLDITTTAAFMVRSSDFPRPSDCVDFCETNVTRRGGMGVAFAEGGIAVEAGAMFRLRFATQFLAPAGDFAIVAFHDPCTAECADGARRCDDDNACYRAGSSYCQACDHESQQRCACVGPDGDRPEGSDCTIITGDIAEVGTCSAEGTCERTDF